MTAWYRAATAFRATLVDNQRFTGNRMRVLTTPSKNQLEALKGDRKGQWSIRINNQWRVCFRFDQGDAFDVEIVDYH